jgi:PDZ domain-containing secreted protein/Zn-dependent protease/CBS domain-containing protein
MESSFRIARVGGIEIGASWSWLLVVAIVVWSLAASLFPATYPDLSGGTHIVMALVTAVLFFASILLHELGHARRALREGVPIEGITLWLFGGVAKLGGNPPSAGAAFRVAALGPVVSAVLAVVFGAAAYAGSQLGVHDAVQGVVDYLARINALVLAFNLVPALPLDGGRILQALIWHRTGSSSGATMQAANAGRLFGHLLIGIGLLGLFTGTGIGAIWVAFIGWFLVQAAGMEAAHALLRRALGRMRVRDAMTPVPVTVPPDLSVAAFVDEAWRARHSTYPVVADGSLAGLVSARAASDVPTDERGTRRVAEIMTPRAELATVTAGQELADVVQHFDVARNRLPVVDDGRLVGVLAPSDIAGAVELGEARAGAAEEPTGRRRSPGLLVWGVVGLTFLAAAGFLYYPPLVVMAPGDTIAIQDDITIDGVPVTDIDGSYRLTAVRIDQTNALGTLVAWIRSDREVLRLEDVVPRGIDPDDYTESQRDLFDESRELAAAAGASAAGFDVPVDGDGARVTGVLRDGPAADWLEPDDVIVAVDDAPVATAAALRDRLQGQPAGTSIALTVERADGGAPQEIELETASLPEVSSSSGIGVVLTTQNLTVDLPFDISFTERPNLAGPSAGLAFALAVADLLDDADIAAGRDIAATGTISADGLVGPVGGVDLKAIAADDAGADLFVVPEADAAEARGEDIAVRASRSLDEALELLRSTS